MLLLFFSGATSSSTGSATVANPKGCGFQVPNGFQKSGFQNCGTKKVVGWHPSWSFRHAPEELERRLAQQRGVSSAWFGDFIEAQRSASIRVKTSKSVKHREVLDAAAATVYAAVEDAVAEGLPPPTDLIETLRAAALASRITASIKHAERILEDDEEEIELLLLH